MRRNVIRILGIAVISLLSWQALHVVIAQEAPGWMKGLPQQYNSIWKVHDTNRPKPKSIDPGKTSQDAPADAVVLFDGSGTSQWSFPKRPWKVENGYMELNGGGSATSKEKFGDCQLHLEYMSPTPPQKKSQARGNSGLLFMGHYEVQVLDNHDNPTYPDGYIGAVYGQHPPLVNAGRKPGEWQTYDVIFRAPRFKDGKISEPARFTVFVNGVVVQHNAEVYGRVRWRGLATYKPHEPTGPLVLQDHGDGQKPRFRNIWMRRLDLSWEAIDQRKQ